MQINASRTIKSLLGRNVKWLRNFLAIFQKNYRVAWLKGFKLYFQMK